MYIPVHPVKKSDFKEIENLRLHFVGHSNIIYPIN